MPDDIFSAPGQPAEVTPAPQPPAPPAQASSAQPAPPTTGAGDTPGSPPPPPQENIKNLNDLLSEFVELTPAEKAKGVQPQEPTGVTPAAPAPAAPAPKPPKKPSKTPKAPVAPPPPPAPTATEIAAATAEAVARAIKASEPKPAPPPEGPKLDVEDQYEYDVLAHLETMDPKHKGIADQFKTVQLKAYEYQQKWEKEHPGQPFDPEADEHNEWRSTSGFDEFVKPEVEFRNAEVDMHVQNRLAQERQESNARLSKIEQAERARAAQPLINQHVAASRKTFWKTLGDEFADVITEAGAPDKAKIDAALAADKAALKVVYTAAPAVAEAILSGELAPPPLPTAHRLSAAVALDTEVPQIYSLMSNLTPLARHPGEFDPSTAIPDPNKPGQTPWQAWQGKVVLYQTHQEILRFGAQMERDIQAQPPHEQLDAQQRPFVTLDRYLKLPRADQAKVWTLTPDLVIAYRTQYWSRKAAENIAADEAKLAAFAKTKGITLPAKATQTRPAAAAVAPQNTNNNAGNPRSPSTSAPSKMAASRNAALPVASDALSSWVAEGF